MEAATSAAGVTLLPRDGAVPAASPRASQPLDTGLEAIDGVARCTCCSRFPLLGEQVIRHQSSREASWVCEACEATGRGKRAGAIAGRARIRSLGGAMNVRRIP